MTAEQKFKRAVQTLWVKGYYPSPTRLNHVVHNRDSSNLNGNESRWRREVMAQLGIPLQRPSNRRKDRFGVWTREQFDIFKTNLEKALAETTRRIV